METSLTHFELKNGSDSGSEKNEPSIDQWALGDTDSSNGNKSDEDFDNNLPDTVRLLIHEKTGAKLYLVGTAHFSKESQNDVEKVIQKVRPDVVVLELCKSRTNILTLDEDTILKEAQSLNMQKIISTIKASGFYNGIMYLLLLDISAHITKEIGMAPGGEFRVAFREATRIPNCKINLGDRPIGITLQRALSRLSWMQTIKLVRHLLDAKEPISVEDIEKCKGRDILEQLLADFGGEYPEFKNVFLEERDIFLTNSLQSAAAAAEGLEKSSEPYKIVGVVGIGHVPGIEKLWPYDQKPYLKDIITIPPPSRTSKFIKFSFKISLYVASGYFVYRFVPVPKFFKDNIHVFFQSMLTSINSNKFHFNYNRI